MAERFDSSESGEKKREKRPIKSFFYIQSKDSLKDLTLSFSALPFNNSSRNSLDLEAGAEGSEIEKGNFG